MATDTRPHAGSVFERIALREVAAYPDDPDAAFDHYMTWMHTACVALRPDMNMREIEQALAEGHTFAEDYSCPLCQCPDPDGCGLMVHRGACH